MSAIQSGIAKYHCLYTEGAVVAFQAPGVFLIHTVEILGKVGPGLTSSDEYLEGLNELVRDTANSPYCESERKRR